MMDRALNWMGVIVMPTLAGSFAYDIYHGVAADWVVWFYAYLGLLHTFIICAAGLREPT